MEAVKTPYEKYADLKDDLKSDPLVAISALKACRNAAFSNGVYEYFDDIIPFFREHLPDTLKNSQEFILLALSVHRGAVKFASESVLRENAYHVALVAINLNRHLPFNNRLGIEVHLEIYQEVFFSKNHLFRQY